MSRIIDTHPFLDDRGFSLHDIFSNLPGQVNYSTLVPGVIKAWHRHEKQTDWWCCLNGNVKVALYDQDADKFETYFIGELNPKVVEIPPGLWHGMTSIGNAPCGMLYYVDVRYNPAEPDEERAAWDAFDYDWSVENK